SAEIISPSNFLAICTAMSLLPEAVGPTITITFGFSTPVINLHCHERIFCAKIHPSTVGGVGMVTSSTLEEGIIVHIYAFLNGLSVTCHSYLLSSGLMNH